MLTMKTNGIVPNERPYTAPTVTWNVSITLYPFNGHEPVTQEFNVPRGAAFISGPGYVDDVFRYLQDLADDEYLDIDEMASCFLDYEPEAHTPEEIKQAREDAEALAALGAKISKGLAPILALMGPQDEDD